jgi:hypothetical protein
MIRHNVRMPDNFNDAKVDLVAQSPDGASVLLYVVQAQPWTGSDEQIASLQAKIHNYVGFVLDGQMERTYPDVAGLPWEIVIDCQTGLPDPVSEGVLGHLAEVLPRYGGSLAIRQT